MVTPIAVLHEAMWLCVKSHKPSLKRRQQSSVDVWARIYRLRERLATEGLTDVQIVIGELNLVLRDLQRR